MNLLKFLSFFLISLFQSHNIDSADQLKFNESDLSFRCSSNVAGITFFNREDAMLALEDDCFTANESYYSSAIIYSKNSSIGDLSLREHTSGIYYLCLDDESRYANLDEILYLRKQFIDNLSNESTKSPTEKYALNTKTSVETLANQIKSSSNVVVTFGAGISAGYVPTLEGFLGSLGMEKAFSDDSATEDSFEKFVRKLVFEKDLVLKTVHQEWVKVAFCNVKSTPAHEALKKIYDHLTQHGKNVLVYTDNIDKIHKRLDIPLSEKMLPDGYEIIYPSEELLKSGKTVVITIGQGFDLLGVLSIIKARSADASDILFYSINPFNKAIMIHKDFDPDKLNLEDDDELGFDLSQFQKEPLDMQWIEGSGHDLLPKLLNLLNSETNN